MGDSFTGLGWRSRRSGASVLAISSEYTTGLIRTSFAAVPRRRPVIAAKAAVLGVISLLAGELIRRRRDRAGIPDQVRHTGKWRPHGLPAVWLRSGERDWDGDGAKTAPAG